MQNSAVNNEQFQIGELDTLSLKSSLASSQLSQQLDHLTNQNELLSSQVDYVVNQRDQLVQLLESEQRANNQLKQQAFETKMQSLKQSKTEREYCAHLLVGLYRDTRGW
ncbi:Hypothetical_protein [Hexamita inflata]|uniref:Hypothetical_protein n=1 Tax=Hexamita inflata TaxID=28002 RepID=A0AA86PQ49_9EUKA|nr:Hypothetical protein HINF_LOCUS30326 [Hexamita inflata]